MKKYLLFILYFLFLPIVLFIQALMSQRSVGKKICYAIFVLVVIFPVWTIFVPTIREAIQADLYSYGIIDDENTVRVSGTSMTPTIRDGDMITLHNPKKYPPTRGDIVSVKNVQTDGDYYLKRIVGMPGEKVSLQNGHVLVNGKVIKEPYTLHNLPTYGNSGLVECEEYSIPAGHYMVLGDNRTVSQDSRVIGFVSHEDIFGVQKTNTQLTFESSADQSRILSQQMNPEKFVEKLNSLRESTKSGTLRYSAPLSELAKKRSEFIHTHIDDWKQNALSLNAFLDNEKYRYNLAHEYITQGYLDEQGLLDQIMNVPTQETEFLSRRYYDVGIGMTEHTKGVCTYSIINVILSWPSKPDYDAETLKYWQEEARITKQILRNVQTYVGVEGYDQVKLRKLITNMAQEVEISERMLARVKNNEWLDQKDIQDRNRYSELVKESNALIDELFPKEGN